MSNRHLITYIGNRIGSLRNEFVFVGGSIVELLLDEDYPLSPRPTKDVDAIVGVCNRNHFNNIEKKLRKLGFKNNIIDGVICRWEIDGAILDVMPTDPNILGFSNRWYQPALKYAQKVFLEPELEILLISATYFLATKLEAFENRGNQDFYASHDLEDIVTVLDGRESLFNEILSSDKDVQSFIVQTFIKYQKQDQFIESLPGHLSPYNALSSARAERIESIVEKIINIKL